MTDWRVCERRTAEIHTHDDDDRCSAHWSASAALLAHDSAGLLSRKHAQRSKVKLWTNRSPSAHIFACKDGVHRRRLATATAGPDDCCEVSLVEPRQGFAVPCGTLASASAAPSERLS